MPPAGWSPKPPHRYCASPPVVVLTTKTRLQKLLMSTLSPGSRTVSVSALVRRGCPAGLPERIVPLTSSRTDGAGIATPTKHVAHATLTPLVQSLPSELTLIWKLSTVVCPPGKSRLKHLRRCLRDQFLVQLQLHAPFPGRSADIGEKHLITVRHEAVRRVR